MSLLNTMMDVMIKRIPKEKREEMMTNMMPMMMEGIDINELMPKMTKELLKDVTVDDVVNYLKKTLKETEKLQELVTKMKEASVMQKIMLKTYKSKLNFEETVAAIQEAAPQNGWKISDSRDLQKEYQEAGLSDMTKLKILYLRNPQGEYAVLSEDKNKAISVFMPTGLSVYETSEGRVEIAAMNLDVMSGMIAGAGEEVLDKEAKNLKKTLEGIVESQHTPPDNRH